MENEQKLPLSHKPRSGSGNRKMQRLIGVRVTEDVYGRLDAEAAAKRLTVPSYVRDFILKTPGIRSRRRPLVDVAALAKLIAELNRIGGNINQLARSENYGEGPDREALRLALSSLRELMQSARIALGFES